MQNVQLSTGVNFKGSIILKGSTNELRNIEHKIAKEVGFENFDSFMLEGSGKNNSCFYGTFAAAEKIRQFKDDFHTEGGGKYFGQFQTFVAENFKKVFGEPNKYTTEEAEAAIKKELLS